MSPYGRKLATSDIITRSSIGLSPRLESISESVAGLLLNYMQSCIQDPARSRLFGRVYDAQKLNDPSRLELLRTVMLGFKATVDSPCADVYQELKMLYPAAKVILNVRDSEFIWWYSMKDTIDVVFSTRYAF